jgi:hypothetical protein
MSILTRSLIALAILSIFFLAVFAWPTRYRYDHWKDVPVRIDRFSGRAEVLDYDGWRELKPTPTPEGFITRPPNS